jgi:hypothetical protein
MTRYLYEKDLVAMKYAILISTRHDRLVREIARDLGMSHQNLRKYMIDRFDMILMENLPARYEAGKAEIGNDAPLADALGRVLYTRYIPLLERETMNGILEQVRAMIVQGVPQEEAVARGKKMIGEELRL